MAKTWQSKIDSGFEKIVALASNEIELNTKEAEQADAYNQPIVNASLPPPIFYPSLQSDPLKKVASLPDPSITLSSKRSFPRWRLLNWTEDS